MDDLGWRRLKTRRQKKGGEGVPTCWSSGSEGPGPCWAPAGQGCAGVRENAGASACWRTDWRNLRSPGRESSLSRWLRSRCGSDSGAYLPPHLWTLDKDRHRTRSVSFQGKCHICCSKSCCTTVDEVGMDLKINK